MRIGLIRMKHTDYGGAEVYLSRLIDGLIEKGHTIDLFSSGWKQRDGVNFHKIKVSDPRFLRPILFALRAKKAVEDAGPDIVISLERTWCQDIYRAGDGCHRQWLIQKAEYSPWWKRLSTKLNPLHYILLYAENRLFSDKRLKAAVANSTMVKADIQRHYGLPEEKLCVIYNGINPLLFNGLGQTRVDARREMGLCEATVLLLFVGSGFERKGLIYAIRALSLLKDKGDIRLAIVGKGRTERYRKEAARLGVGDRVMFHGPRKDIRRYYASADIFVLPTIYEPFSNACLEAMAAGLPVVTTGFNGASEIIKEGVSGAVVEDPADAPRLAAKLSLFLDRGAREKAGEAAISDARKYTIEKNTGEFLALIDRIRRSGTEQNEKIS